MINILINEDGTINAMGLDPYPLICPDFINLDNARFLKCIDIENHMERSSWIDFLPEEY